MTVAYHELYSINLPEAHRFPMEKYELLYRNLLHEGLMHESEVLRCERIDISEVTPIHCENYVQRFMNLELSYQEQRRTGFMHTADLVERELIIMEATKQCAIEALKTGYAFNIAGGTHHAYRDRGEGFCMLNDQAIAAHHLLVNQLAKKVLIVDLDVHQGNGTAHIFRNVPEVFTFSMHGKNNYPLHKELSDRDIVINDGVGDDEYLTILTEELGRLKEVNADFVFYQCGVDILETDKLGKLAVSKAGVKERDEILFRFVCELGAPVVSTMGGGYSERISDILDAHMNTFRVAAQLFD